MGKITAHLSTTGAGTATVTIPSSPVINQDNITTHSPVDPNHIAITVALTAGTPLDILFRVEETRTVDVGVNPPTYPSGIPIATGSPFTDENGFSEYPVTITLTNSSVSAWPTVKAQLGYGMGGSFNESSLSDFIDFDASDRDPFPVMVPESTAATALANSIDYNAVVGNIQPAAVVTVKFNLDLSDGWNNATDNIPAAGNRVLGTPGVPGTFELTLRLSATTTAPAVVPPDGIPQLDDYLAIVTYQLGGRALSTYGIDSGRALSTYEIAPVTKRSA